MVGQLEVGGILVLPGLTINNWIAQWPARQRRARRRQDYAGVMWRLIAYSRSSAFVLTFNVSIIRYL
jgi:hypothetical protein